MMKKVKLVADLGNTTSKLALFEGNQMVDLRTFPSLGIEALKSFLSGHLLQGSILSSVVRHSLEIEEWLEKKAPFVRFTHQTQLPIKLAYKTPETLGQDRLANAVALNHQFPGQIALAVDVGTCIKFDLVDDAGVYRGGAISPGLNIRFQALHNFTDQLPLISDADIPSLTGTSTAASIRAGVYHGMFHEINGMINAYRAQHPGLITVITGGDAGRFPIAGFSQKNHIFADALFTLKGLHTILTAYEKA